MSYDVIKGVRFAFASLSDDGSERMLCTQQATR